MARFTDLKDDQEFETRREAVIHEIEVAFAGVRRLDGVTLHEAIVLDDYGTKAEQEAARHLDPEENWQDVPDAAILNCASALSFLDEKGFRFYLPAFMRLGLQDFIDDPNGIRTSCEFHLTRDHPKSLRKSEPTDIAQKYEFTPQQIRAIAHFLRLVADFDPYHEGILFLTAVEKWEQLVAAQAEEAE